MPHTLSLTYAPRLQVHARQIPGWRRIQAIADAAVESFVTLWRGLFMDAREALPLSTLTEALTQPQILDAVALLDTTWHTAVEAPAWAYLPPLATTLVQEAGTASLPALEAQLGVALTMTAFLPETEQWITTYAGTQIRDITATSREAIRAVLREGWTTGQAPQDLARALRQVRGLTPRQAGTITRLRETMAAEGKTAAQITRAVEEATARGIRQRALVIGSTESQSLAARGAWDAMNQTIRSGIVQADQVRRFWGVSNDEHTCFCRGTIVATPTGGVPIEHLQPGDKVLTHEGERQLLATMVRPFAGILVILHTTADTIVIMTEDHPVSIKGEWQEAGTLLPGDTLETLNQERLEVRNIVHLSLQNMQDCPSSLSKEPITPCFLRRVLMPIDTIDFKRNLVFDQSKIYNISSDRIFLNKGNIKSYQEQAHETFGACFPFKDSIAAPATKLSIYIRRYLTEKNTTGPTGNMYRRTPADFRTIMIPLMPCSCKDISTALTGNSNRVFGSTSKRANSITISDGSRNGEREIADRTDFCYEERLSRQFIAGTRAKTSVPSFAHAHLDTKRLPALFTLQIKRTLSYKSQAFPRAIDTLSSVSLSASKALSAICTIIGKRHASYLQKIINQYSTYYSIPVYDITVERAHAFYAGGFLVHNCNICAAIPGLNPDGVTMDEPFQTPIGLILLPTAHPNCRCYVDYRIL